MSYDIQTLKDEDGNNYACRIYRRGGKEIAIDTKIFQWVTKDQADEIIEDEFQRAGQ